MNNIIAKRVTIIKKDGTRIDLTHVTMFRAMGYELWISGETDDDDGMREVVHKQYRIKDLQLTQIDWYIPK